jgi:serine/threonine-protein kinase ULK2
MKLVLGSPLYMAPELIKRQTYTEKIDVWSLGVITYQLLSGRTPFESRSIKKIDWNICNKEISFLDTQQENWSDISC